MADLDATAALRQEIERVKSNSDPTERDLLLTNLEENLNDLLGRVRTYRNDAKLQEGASDG